MTGGSSAPIPAICDRDHMLTLDGHVFESVAMARRYAELKVALAAGKIEELKVWPIYDLQVNDVHLCNYKAEFEYIDRATSAKIVEHFDWSSADSRARASRSTVKMMMTASADRRLAQMKDRLVEALIGVKVVTLRPKAQAAASELAIPA